MHTQFDPTRPFVGRQVFPATDENTAVLRFLLCVRQSEALQRSVERLVSKAPSEIEQFHFHVLLMVGAVKEAADAFRDCDSQGHFSWLDQPHTGPDDFRQDLVTARRLVDRNDPTSTYSRILKPFRDRAGFHFNRDRVRRALEALADEEFPAARVGSNTEVQSVPLVLHLLAHLSWAGGLAPEDVTLEVNNLYDLQSALRNVAHDFYFALVRVRSSVSPTS